MDTVSKTFDCICRLCLKLYYNSGQMSPLLNSENKLSSYGKIFQKITNIEVEINDKLPKNLCVKCKQELDKIQSFRFMCKSNNQSLLLLVNNDYKNATLDEKKEIICTYAMYRHYLPERCKEVKKETLRTPEKQVKIPLEKPTIVKSELDEKVDDNSTNFDDTDDFSDTSDKKKDTENADILFSRMEKLYSSKLLQRKPRIKIKKPPEKFFCPICKKKLANSKTFEGHMNTHRQNRFICDQCGKAMSTKSALETHLVARHHVPSAYECDYCGFGAPRRHELIEHIRLHTGERPYTCDKCGANFRRQAIWKLHLKCHEDRLITCSLCPKKFTRNSDLKTHVNNVHDRVYLYLCKICHTSYARGGTVRKHMISKHGIPREHQGKITRVTKATHRGLFQDKNGLDNDLL